MFLILNTWHFLLSGGSGSGLPLPWATMGNYGHFVNICYRVSALKAR